MLVKLEKQFPNIPPADIEKTYRALGYSLRASETALRNWK